MTPNTPKVYILLCSFSVFFSLITFLIYVCTISKLYINRVNCALQLQSMFNYVSHTTTTAIKRSNKLIKC